MPPAPFAPRTARAKDEVVSTATTPLAGRVDGMPRVHAGWSGGEGGSHKTAADHLGGHLIDKLSLWEVTVIDISIWEVTVIDMSV